MNVYMRLKIFLSNTNIRIILSLCVLYSPISFLLSKIDIYSQTIEHILSLAAIKTYKNARKLQESFGMISYHDILSFTLTVILSCNVHFSGNYLNDHF